ncbi:hypothetical protein SNE40_009999 [Patella caerulea]|uniref:Hexosyltransferase n=1 Tax=Patella caerulea TaxID=87958 RepID=A0AAN8JPN1_PATCE
MHMHRRIEVLKKIIGDENNNVSKVRTAHGRTHSNGIKYTPMILDPKEVTKGRRTYRNGIKYTSLAMYPLTVTSKYVIYNENICSDVTLVTVLVMVHSAVKHYARRHNIRSTYGSRVLFKPAVVRVIFLLGLPAKHINIDQYHIKKEAELYRDIVQGDFVDTYHNLTNKAVMGLRWVSENCRNAKFVVKVDDDAVFDMWKFINKFPETGNGKTMWCNIMPKAIVHRSGKWAVPVSDFQGYQTYPWPYCGGFVVIMNGELVPELFNAARTSPFFWIDDVYVYGILRSKVQGCLIKNMPAHFNLHVFQSEGRKCLASMKCGLLATAGTEDNFRYMWGLLISSNFRR